MRIGTHRDPAMVLVLILVTCGAYYIYWVYKVSGETQEFLNEPDTSPAVELLLTALTCGLYLFYWDWKTAEKIARMQARVGLPVTNNAVLYLVLNILGAGPAGGLGLIVPLIEQGHLNDIWRAAAGQQGGRYVS